MYHSQCSDRFATLSTDQSIRIWDASDYSVVTKCSVQGLSSIVVPTSLAYSPDVLISGWMDGTIRCFGCETGEFLWQIEHAHVDGVTALVLSHNERFLVTGGSQGKRQDGSLNISFKS